MQKLVQITNVIRLGYAMLLPFSQESVPNCHFTIFQKMIGKLCGT